MVGPPTSPANLSSASDTEASAAAADVGQTCCCDSCNERRFVLIFNQSINQNFLEWPK